MRRLFCLLLLAGCPAPRSQCSPSTPSAVELRDGKGVLLVAAKPGPKGAIDVCNGQLARVGTLKPEGVTMTLLDRGGSPRLMLRRLGTDDAIGTAGDGQTRLRVHREGKQLFVLDPIGVRLGSVLVGDKTVFYDQRQTPAGTVEPRGPDQAVRDPDGATLFLVQPAESPQLAGLFTVAGLDSTEQLALFLLFSR
jgi:hypothetical protein